MGMHASPAERSDEQELEDLVAEGFIRFDHVNENGQNIYRLTDERSLIEQELEYLAAEGFICFDQIDDNGKKIYRLTETGQIALTSEDEHSGLKLEIFTEMGRIARMTRKEHIDLIEKCCEAIVAEGTLRVSGVNEKGKKVYGLTEAGLLEADLLEGKTQH
jgi:DNA-binding PadR family transcriptional regulator